MKKSTNFSALALLAIGFYYSLQTFQIELFENQQSWQTLLILFGLVFLISGHFDQDDSAILPGILLLGLGIHFHSIERFPNWPEHAPAITLIIGLGMLLRAAKTKSGYFQGFILLLLAVFLHSFDSIINGLGWVEQGMQVIQKFWPVLLILGGFYLLFIKRK
ncbi:DUF5668 domain-containing protein [Bacillus sp. F19]|nr:DUF5668 domain-containing protein [Bacillus sp. F19]